MSKKIDSQKFMKFVLEWLYSQKYLKYQHLINEDPMSFEVFMREHELYEEE